MKIASPKAAYQLDNLSQIIHLMKLKMNSTKLKIQQEKIMRMTKKIREMLKTLMNVMSHLILFRLKKANV